MAHKSGDRVAMSFKGVVATNSLLLKLSISSASNRARSAVLMVPGLSL